MLKTLFLLILFISITLQSKATYSQSSDTQLDYYKSNLNDLKDNFNNLIFPSPYPDTLIINGEATDNYFGISVSSAGDVNGDGYSDVIIGAHGYNNFGVHAGRAYIYFGGSNMDNLADVIFTGESEYEFLGRSVTTAGDVNGDGYCDVIVGLPINSSFYPGKAYIYFGGNAMDNTIDIILTGESANDNFGYSVSAAGDVNRDGFDDVIVGAEYDGKAYIYYGGSTMNNVADVTLKPETSILYFGISVSSTGDVNGDGYSDVIVGAYGNNTNTSRAYIYFGGGSMNNTADIILTNESVSSSSNFGISVSSAGDLNRDGYSDVIVGVSGYNADNKGRAYIYYGGSEMNSESDLILTGATINDKFGCSVSAAGDMNRDGYSDVIVGADGYNYNTGRSYIFYGGVNMDSLADVILTGETQNNLFGNSVSSVGDFNADGFSDVIVGANGFNNTIGRSYIYITNPAIVRINMKVLMEGMYSPIFNQLTRKDIIKVYLRNSSPPYAVVDSSKGTIDSIACSGLFNFLNTSTGTYYLVLKHFNCIETWSKVGGESLESDGSIYNYDFTSSNTQAYWNNLKLNGSKYCVYSGDVNQDGYINLFDVIQIYNAATNFVTGRYLSTDLNGDNIIDLTDLTLCYNNSTNFIRLRRP